MLTTACPQCRARLQIASLAARGARFDCPRCGARFSPTLGSGDRDRARDAGRDAGEPDENSNLLIGLIAGAGVLAIGVAVSAVMFLAFRSENRNTEVAQATASPLSQPAPTPRAEQGRPVGQANASGGVPIVPPHLRPDQPPRLELPPPAPAILPQPPRPEPRPRQGAPPPARPTVDATKNVDKSIRDVPPTVAAPRGGDPGQVTIAMMNLAPQKYVGQTVVLKGKLWGVLAGRGDIKELGVFNENEVKPDYLYFVTSREIHIQLADLAIGPRHVPVRLTATVQPKKNGEANFVFVSQVDLLDGQGKVESSVR